MMSDAASREGCPPVPHVPQLAAYWLQQDESARIIVAADGALLWRNFAAEQLLVSCPDLEVHSGFLVVQDSAHQQVLIEFLRRAEAKVTSFCLLCADGDGHLLFHARRLEADARAIGLIVQHTGSRFEARYATFQRAFGLTDAEYQVVLMLVEGHTAETVAERSGVSVGTVRSHIRSVYAKLHVSSREQLFYKLRPFRIA
jgi:DNA-binding CsgD family transcriptional regulator